MDKKLEKQIDNLIEQRKSFWTIIIVLNGGITGLLLTFCSPLFCPSNIIRFILLIIGVLFDFAFVKTLIKMNLKIIKLLK
jgi:hypothetical protein